MKELKILISLLVFVFVVFLLDCTIFSFGDVLLVYLRELTGIAFLSFILFRTFTLISTLIASFFFGLILKYEAKLIGMFASLYFLIDLIRLLVNYRYKMPGNNWPPFSCMFLYIIFMVPAYFLGVVFFKLGKKVFRRS